jgi:hypothetical protein
VSPPDQAAVTVLGADFLIRRMGDREQFEVEVLIVRLLAPGIARGLGQLAEGLGDQAVVFLRAVVGEGDGFDLSLLAEAWEGMATTDGPVQLAWESLLERLPALGGDVLGATLPAIADRLEFEPLMRIFALSVLGRTTIMHEGRERRLDFEGLQTLSRGRPGMKWRLLAEALRHNYLPTAPEADLEQAAE